MTLLRIIMLVSIIILLFLLLWGIFWSILELLNLYEISIPFTKNTSANLPLKKICILFVFNTIIQYISWTCLYLMY